MNKEARAFSLTSATLNLSASPNVTPGLQRMAQVPMGLALTSHYASLGPEKPVDMANIELLSAGLSSAEWTTREYAATELVRLGRQYPDRVRAAIAPLLESSDPELRSRGRIPEPEAPIRSASSSVSPGTGEA